MKRELLTMTAGIVIASGVSWSGNALSPGVTAPTAISMENTQEAVSPIREESQGLEDFPETTGSRSSMIRELSPKEIKETRRYKKAIATQEEDEAAVIRALRMRSAVNRMKTEAEQDVKWLRWCQSNPEECQRQTTVQVLKKKIRLYQRAGVSTQVLENILQNIQHRQGGEK